MDYKSTLNLPKTTFPMRGNLSQTEPKILAQWEKDRTYQEGLRLRQEKKAFILHDGPPYANGDIHMGHALNKILKDIIVRYRSMQGAYAPYVPGWDCHGLPIEYALMKELKVTKHQVQTVDFRRKARQFATKYVQLQREQFKRLGCWGDWEHPYLTLDPGYVAAALRSLKALVEKNFVYQARRPVNWCWVCETALAEAEVEYEAHVSPSIYVKFELDLAARKELLPSDSKVKQLYLIIWTTTPWTLMGNVAVAVHPNFEYTLTQMGSGEVWVTLADLPEDCKRPLGLTDPKAVVKTVRGKQLEGLTYRHPLISREGKVVLADYVSAEEGTGLVHTAPGFGAEDYLTGRKYNLEVLAPVDAQGKFVGLPEEVASLNGKQVQQANKDVVQLLKEKELLIRSDSFKHSYPHCWRCHNPIIFRATDQWFLRIDQAGLREELLSAIQKEVEWIPSGGRERIGSMVAGRPDWCLSRQRLWGIPIPAVVCEACGEGILDPRVIEKFAEASESDPEGTDLWFSQEGQAPSQEGQAPSQGGPAPSQGVSRWLPQGFSCRCGKQKFKAGSDILDVWFDSGVSHRAVLERWKNLSAPADLYLEGSDQHRGWFQVSLITSVALEGRAPYRSVLTHGFVVDGHGKKMSKSSGNVIAPQKVVSSRGADVLRLWVAASDYREDIRLSEEILNQTAEVYRKIRNTIRFCLANVADFNPQTAGVAPERLQSLERWMLLQLGSLLEEVTAAYDRYAFHRVVRILHAFCTVRLSNFYLDVIKDRLYTAHPEDPARRGAQTVLFHLADVLIRSIAPILPMTAEEAWAALYPDSRESVHFQSWPKPGDFRKDSSGQGHWDQLLRYRDQAMKVLEEARGKGLIGNPLEAQLEVAVGNEQGWNFLESHQEELAAACVVSELRLTRKSSLESEVAFSVKPAPGSKCQRCWMRLLSVGKSNQHPELCHRCVQVLKRLEERGGG